MITNQPNFTACKITPERGGRTAVGTFADLSVKVAGAQARIAATQGVTTIRIESGVVSVADAGGREFLRGA